jgi:DNA-binding CsgD family transcriptional regulator
MFISSDHPIFQLEKQMEKICQPFLQAHGLNYFQYGRCYADGSVALLLNKTSLLRHFIELDYSSFSSYKEENHRQLSYWFLWDEELPWLPVQIAREDHQLHHGITFLRRSLNYYDMIGFAMPEERSNASSYYLSKLKVFEYFISFFEKKYNELLTKATNNPVQVPEINRDRNYLELCLKNLKQVPVIGATGPTYVTAQELSCLQLWLQGVKGKEMTYKLSLSPKTIETYLARIKSRSGFNNRLDLLEMISHCR